MSCSTNTLKSDHHIFCIWLGILAYRGKWFDSISDTMVKQCRSVALVTICSLPVVVGLSISAGNGPDVFLGGFSWQAFTAAAWEFVACLSIIIWLLHLMVEGKSP